MEQAAERKAGNVVAEKELEACCHDKPDGADEKGEPRRSNGRDTGKNPDIDGEKAKPDHGRDLMGAQLGHVRSVCPLTKRSVEDREGEESPPVR